MDMESRLLTMLVVLAVSGGLLATVFPAPARAAVPCIPSFFMQLDAAEQYARTAGGASTTVTFSGRMGIDHLPVERCVVTLAASTDTGWATRVTPTVAVFTNTTPKSFNCTVVVPAGTLQNQTANLVVKVHANAGGRKYNSETKGLVRVQPYYRIWLSTDTPFSSIVQGGRSAFTITACNGGNGIDTIEMEIMNLDELNGKGWTVNLSADTLPHLQPGENRSVRLTAVSPWDDRSIVDKVVTILINASSRNAQNRTPALSQSFPFTIQVRSVWLPSLSPYLVILSLSVAAAYLATAPGLDQQRRR
jgi:hypothetical protein